MSRPDLAFLAMLAGDHFVRGARVARLLVYLTAHLGGI